MSFINYALRGNARQRDFGSFKLPDCSYIAPYDSFRQVSAMKPAKYERGMFYYQRNLTNPILQKIQVLDIVWQTMGTAAQGKQLAAEIEHWVNVELTLALQTYNQHCEYKIQADLMTFYSDNPDYAPGTVPRILVCRLSHPADFE